MTEPKDLSEGQLAGRRAFYYLSLRMKEICDGDQALWRLMNLSVSRVLLPHVDRANPNPSAGVTVAKVAAAIYHVRDWLKSSLVNDVPWLRNVNEKGVPKKLLKCRDMGDLVREADKDMRKQNAAIARKPLVNGDEALEFECAHGWKIVRLLTPAALDRESGIMQHCIGNGAYDARLADDQFRYLSLRDPSGKPHGTMELCGDRLIQFQGKQNATPLEKYVRIAMPFFRERRISCTDADCGLVTDETYETYSVYEMPESLVVRGRHLVLKSTSERKLRLPKFIQTTGSLALAGVFENVPECILVGGDLAIDRRSSDGYVGGEHGETSFDRLPARIHVLGDMTIRHIPVTELASDMRVEGRLDVAGTGITVLPNSLRCGSLDICYTAVKEFDTVHFISEKPEPRRRILEARFSKLERIVGDARFSKLDLSGSALVELPKGLRVDGDLNIDFTPVRHIPDDIEVGGSLRVDKCAIPCLPEHLNVRGYAYFDHSVVRLPLVFRMPGSLCIRDGVIEAMAEDIEAENILLIGSALPGLASRIRTGKLHLDRTSVRRIEGDVAVRELDVCEDFQHLGDDVRVSKKISVHCREPRNGPRYCIAELTESDARAMLKKKGKLDFRGVRKVPKIEDPEEIAADRRTFKEINDLAVRFGAAA